MTINKIILESLAKNPLGIKEAFSSVLAEKVRASLEEKVLDEANKGSTAEFETPEYKKKALIPLKNQVDFHKDMMDNHKRKLTKGKSKEYIHAHSLAAKAHEEAHQKNSYAYSKLSSGVSNVASYMKPAIESSNRAIEISTAAHMLKEDFGQLDELSKDTLLSYNRKAHSELNKDWVDTDRRTKDVGLGDRKVKNRFDGTAKAVSKIERIDEISKSILASYIKKAPGSATSLKFKAINAQKKSFDMAWPEDARRYEDEALKNHHKFDNRIKGVAKATDRLVKE